MSEALARRREDVGGFLHLVLFVAGSLGVLDQRGLLFFAHFVELLLGFFELAKVTGKKKGEDGRLMKREVPSVVLIGQTFNGTWENKSERPFDGALNPSEGFSH